jgi:hypothetical protein
LPAARMSARTGQRRAMMAWVMADTVRAASAVPRRPALAQDRDEQQKARDEGVAGYMRPRRLRSGSCGRLPVVLHDPVAKEVSGEQDLDTRTCCEAATASREPGSPPAPPGRDQQPGLLAEAASTELPAVSSVPPLKPSGSRWPWFGAAAVSLVAAALMFVCRLGPGPS